MKLSVVIICWNDIAHIEACLASVFAETRKLEFEVIVTDNGSTDGSIELVRHRFPSVRLLQNGANLGFAGANNRAFQLARGDYVLVLNPDTVVRHGALEKLVAFADLHPGAGAVGCRVLNPDGTYQISAYPVPSPRSLLVTAFGLRQLGRWSSRLGGDTYTGWRGDTDRTIGFQAGCALLLRRPLLLGLNGFDERLFFQNEDADLCFRVWKAGYEVRFHAAAEIVHVGGQNRGRYSPRVVLEASRNEYRFFFKHYGLRGARQLRWISLLRTALRAAWYRGLARLHLRPDAAERAGRLQLLLRWHWLMRPDQFIYAGVEPNLGHCPLGPAADMQAAWRLPRIPHRATAG